jgi:hypothetical protein
MTCSELQIRGNSLAKPASTKIIGEYGARGDLLPALISGISSILDVLSLFGCNAIQTRAEVDENIVCCGQVSRSLNQEFPPV